MLKIQNTYISLHFGDIGTLEVDAIVNPINTGLLMHAGVAGYLKYRLGKNYEKETMAKGPIPLGKAIVTGGGASGKIYYSCCQHENGF